MGVFYSATFFDPILGILAPVRGKRFRKSKVGRRRKKKDLHHQLQVGLCQPVRVLQHVVYVEAVAKETFILGFVFRGPAAILP